MFRPIPAIVPAPMMALALAAAGCTGDDDSHGSDWTPPDGEVISLSTQDGVDLEANYYPSTTRHAPGIVLLHMNPETNDRTNWPPTFIAALGTQRWAVVVPDRRGTGGSGGIAEDAFNGEKGKYDAAACVDWLEADGYDDIVIIGASNGTTTALDYTIWAATGAATVPTALGFMTGGTYTEKNSKMVDLPDLPAVFTTSSDEAGWSLYQQDLDPGTWQYLEYPDGGHGTQMFDAAPEVSDDLVAFLKGVL